MRKKPRQIYKLKYEIKNQYLKLTLVVVLLIFSLNVVFLYVLGSPVKHPLLYFTMFLSINLYLMSCTT